MATFEDLGRYGYIVNFWWYNEREGQIHAGDVGSSHFQEYAYIYIYIYYYYIINIIIIIYIMHMHMHCTSTYIPSASQTHKCVGLIPNARFFLPSGEKKHCFWKIIVSWTLMILLLDHSTPFQYPSGWLYFHPAGLAGSSHQKPLEAEIWTMAVVFPSGRELFLVCHNWTNSSKIVKRSSTNNLIDVLFLNNVIDTVGFVKRTKAKNYLLKNTSSTKKMHFWLDLLFWRCLFADAHRWV